MEIRDPFEALTRWYAEAEASEPRVPDAMQIATVDAENRPSIRTVLLKSFDAAGLVFYTNLESRKGRELKENAAIAAVLHWKSLERQVICEGHVRAVLPAEADAYAQSRPRGSQIGAWASPQSRPIPSRTWLEDRVRQFEERFGDGEIPRPPHWSGFRIVPDRFEFWQGRRDRLHERVELRRVGDRWERGLLAP